MKRTIVAVELLRRADISLILKTRVVALILKVFVYEVPRVPILAGVALICVNATLSFANRSEALDSRILFCF